ncbi:MAG TPA: GntR family transcriptional regulator [Capsulimonadaceae bacterium]
METKQPKKTTSPTTAARPAYREIADALRSQIAAGRLTPGTLLPSHRRMAAEHGVAIGTVQQAVNILVTEGVLVTEANRGLFVATSGVERSRDAARVLPPMADIAIRGAHIGVISPMAYAWPDATEYTESDHEDDLDVRRQIIHPLERALGERGGSTTFHDIGGLKSEFPVKFREAYASLMADNVDGIVLVYVHDQYIIDYVLPAMEKSSVPVVLVNAEESNVPLPRISTDNRAAGYRAAQHLLSQGCENLIFFATFESVWGNARLAGARDAIRLAGRPADCLTVHIAPLAISDIPRHRRQDNIAREFAATIFDPSIQRAGVIAHNDFAAIGYMDTAGKQGLSSGSDYLIVGFDDIRLSRQSGLSTLHPPLADMGAEAAKLLVESLSTGDRTSKRILLNSHLVIRDSSRKRFIDRG